MKTTLHLFIFALLTCQAAAQTTLIKGRVTDASKNPLAGANILLRDTYDGATSDTEGNFEFETGETGRQTLQMTYLDYDGERSFKNEKASCGEFEDRDCGINGSVCRNGQNSVALLTSRLGAKDGAEADPSESPTTTTGPEVGGCATSGSGGPLALGLVGLVVARLSRRRRR